MTHTAIIQRAGYQAMIDCTNAKKRAIIAWRERDSIPTWYWGKIVAAGHATMDELAAGVVAKAAA